MAYAPHRSSVDELHLGAHRDGKYKSAAKDRGGRVESATLRARADLFPVWYGINDPDGAVRPANPQAV